MPPRKRAAEPEGPAPVRTLSTGDIVAGSVSDSFIFHRKSQIVTVRVDKLTVRDDHPSDDAVFTELSELLAAGMERIKGDHIEHKLDGRY